MTCELPDIAQFLSGVAPFNSAGPGPADTLARAAEVMYVRADTKVIEAGTENQHLYLVRSGAVDLHEAGTQWAARLDEGSFFAYPSLLRGAPARNQVTAAEDCLLYRFPADAFNAALDQNEAVRAFFASAEADRLRNALKARNAASSPAGTDTSAMNLRLKDLIARPPVTGSAAMSIRNAAEIMARENVSTLLLVSEAGCLTGILSDKDLRSRVLARGLDPSEPVEKVMTENPISFAADTPLVEAMLAMLRHNFRHLPVKDAEDQLIGLVSGTDMMHQFATSAVQVARAVERAENTQELAELAASQQRMMVDLRKSGLSGERIAALLSGTGLAIHRRAFELAVDAMGPPPIPLAFVCFGSLARGEQTALSDQDNGFILDDSYIAERHGDYFKSLATLVSDTLNACGYVYCGGDIMATNDKWRQPLQTWFSYFEAWTRSPEPKALMHTSIFFDMATVAGEQLLAGRLRDKVLSLTKGSGIFLAQMTENALKARPPLGFFRQFLLTRHGDEAHTFDCKKEGLVPIQDIARVYALAHGVAERGTLARLEALKGKDTMNAFDLQELKDAYEFLTDIRIDHQAEAIADGRAPTNYIDPDKLTGFEREHLRAAFKLIQLHQEGLSRALAGGVY